MNSLMRVGIAGAQNINMAPSQLPRSESEMPAEPTLIVICNYDPRILDSLPPFPGHDPEREDEEDTECDTWSDSDWAAYNAYGNGGELEA